MFQPIVHQIQISFGYDKLGILTVKTIEHLYHTAYARAPMGLLDLPCDGCTEKFPLESKSQGIPSEGFVRNVGGTFNSITVCSDCWRIALEHQCNLDESKDIAKKWKEKARSWKEEQDKKEGPAKALRKKQELASHRKKCLTAALKEMMQELTPEATQLSEDVLLPNEKVLGCDLNMMYF
jgi:hypothetical protein